MKSLRTKAFLICILLAVSFSVLAADTISYQQTGKVNLTQDLNPAPSGGLSVGKLAEITCPKTDSTLGVLSNVYIKVTPTIISQPTGALLGATLRKDRIISTLPIGSGPIRLFKENKLDYTVSRGDMIAGVVRVQSIIWCNRELDNVIVPIQAVVGNTVDQTKGVVIPNIFNQQ